MFSVTRHHIDRVIGAALFLAVVGASLLGWFQQSHQNHVDACQRRVNQAFQTQLLARAAETAKSNAALHRLINSTFTLHGTPAQRQAEFRREVDAWWSKVSATQAIRLPAPQSRTCDD